MNGNGLAPETPARLIQACETIVGSQGVITVPDELRVDACNVLACYYRSSLDVEP
jgi:hypothetical protein